MKKLAFIALTIPSFASAMDRITMAVIIPSQLAPIEIVDEDGDTLLHVMAAQGKTSAIKAMLRMHTPDISTPNKEGLCPDQVAQKNGHTEIAYLLQARASFYSQIKICSRGF